MASVDVDADADADADAGVDGDDAAARVAAAEEEAARLARHVEELRQTVADKDAIISTLDGRLQDVSASEEALQAVCEDLRARCEEAEAAQVRRSTGSACTQRFCACVACSPQCVPSSRLSVCVCVCLCVAERCICVYRRCCTRQRGSLGGGHSTSGAGKPGGGRAARPGHRLGAPGGHAGGGAGVAALAAGGQGHHAPAEQHGHGPCQGASRDRGRVARSRHSAAVSVARRRYGRMPILLSALCTGAEFDHGWCVCVPQWTP